MPEIIGRKEAIARGLTRYFTGKPCCRGHLAEHYARSGNCCDCDAIRYDKYYQGGGGKAGRVAAYAKDAERFRSYSRAYYRRNVEKCREAAKQYSKNNPQRVFLNNLKNKCRAAKIADLIEVLRKEMPELLKEFGL